jgi:hypothetical protein
MKVTKTQKPSQKFCKTLENGRGQKSGSIDSRTGPVRKGVTSKNANLEKATWKSRPLGSAAWA